VDIRPDWNSLILPTKKKAFHSPLAFAFFYSAANKQLQALLLLRDMHSELLKLQKSGQFLVSGDSLSDLSISLG